MASQRQRSLRYAWWRGFALALLAFTGWVAVYGLVDRFNNGVPL